MTTPFADATGARIIKFIDRLSAGRYLDVRLLIEHYTPAPSSRSVFAAPIVSTTGERYR